MRNDDAGRIMSWNHGVSVDANDPQSMWIITPQQINTSGMTFRLSTKRWPRHYIYVNDQGLEWVHGSDHIAEPRGLFYLRPPLGRDPVPRINETTPFIPTSRNNGPGGGFN
ncbi:MAG: hypothetical protein WC756_21510 [Taibaiella sp.]|jgi:hypothetical protein